MAFCLCFNNTKLVQLQKAAAINQENDFLREEYMKMLNNLKRIYDNGEIIINKIALEKLQIYLSVD